ncbi:MAG: class I SAM-dependent methyltransferase [Clostridiales bacterium]|nr:class I SAM-dependent methyltransferase [Clostridiales bacterium]
MKNEYKQQWIATDFPKNMADTTKVRVTGENISYAVQDATNLTYREHSFDAVLANALHIMPDPDSALREIHRVLKPNGLLIVPTFVYDEVPQKLKMRLLEKIRFQTFYHWMSGEYCDYVSERGFAVVEKSLVKTVNVPIECVLVGQKTENN